MPSAQKVQDLALCVFNALEASVAAIEAVALLLQDLPDLAELGRVSALDLRDLAQQLVDVVDIVPQLSHHAAALGFGHGSQPNCPSARATMKGHARSAGDRSCCGTAAVYVEEVFQAARASTRLTKADLPAV